MLNTFNSQNVLFKGQPLAQSISVEKVCKLMSAVNDDFISILDINPVQVGHTLVIPKKEIDYIFDQDDYYLSKILIYSKKHVTNNYFFDRIYM